MMSLLPPNTTKLERAIEAALHGRLAALPLPIRELWNPDTCPRHLLDWLAWAMSVDVWDSLWTEQRKRDVIRAAPFVHQHKGTIGAMRRALAALNIGIEIREWFETGDARGTIRIDAFAENIFKAGLGIDHALLDLIARQIDAVKRGSLHYHLRVGEKFTGIINLRAGSQCSARDRFTHDFEPTPITTTATILVRTASRTFCRDQMVHDILRAA